MKQTKIPLRTCIVTKEQHPKRELLRIVLNKSGEVFVDATGKQNGRGFYIKKDINVLDILKSEKILQKKLNIEIDDEVFEEIKKEIS